MNRLATLVTRQTPHYFRCTKLSDIDLLPNRLKTLHSSIDFRLNHSRCNTNDSQLFVENDSFFEQKRFFSQNADGIDSKHLSETEFEKICSQTLEHLSDYFDELVETHRELEQADVAYAVKCSSFDLIQY